MTKNDLIDAISEATGQTKKAVGDVLDQLPIQIGQALTQGKAVAYHGFGTFEVRQRAARTGRNPVNGETIQIAASKNVAFKAAKRLKDHL